jgi:hypothetical protein
MHGATRNTTVACVRGKGGSNMQDADALFDMHMVRKCALLCATSFPIKAAGTVR